MKHYKKILLLLIVTYSQSSFSQVTFGLNSCKKYFEQESLQICQAAIKGDAKSQYAMARFFGDPNNQANINFNYSFYWHLKLSRSVLKQDLSQPPFINALYNTGVFYQQGLGTEINLKKAFFWFDKAAQKGSPHAMLKLSQAYQHGLGVTSNIDKAKYWLNKAVALNLPEAKVIFAKKLLTKSAPKSAINKAISHLRNASLNNSAEAHLILGKFYQNGTHLKQDTPQAKLHYGQACKLNELIACKKYYEIDSQLEFSKEIDDTTQQKQ